MPSPALADDSKNIRATEDQFAFALRQAEAETLLREVIQKMCISTRTSIVGRGGLAKWERTRYDA